MLTVGERVFLGALTTVADLLSFLRSHPAATCSLLSFITAPATMLGGGNSRSRAFGAFDGFDEEAAKQQQPVSKKKRRLSTSAALHMPGRRDSLHTDMAYTQALSCHLSDVELTRLNLRNKMEDMNAFIEEQLVVMEGKFVENVAGRFVSEGRAGSFAIAADAEKQFSGGGGDSGGGGGSSVAIRQLRRSLEINRRRRQADDEIRNPAAKSKKQQPRYRPSSEAASGGGGGSVASASVRVDTSWMLSLDPGDGQHRLVRGAHIKEEQRERWASIIIDPERTPKQARTATITELARRLYRWGMFASIKAGVNRIRSWCTTARAAKNHSSGTPGPTPEGITVGAAVSMMREVQSKHREGNAVSAASMDAIVGGMAMASDAERGKVGRVRLSAKGLLRGREVLRALTTRAPTIMTSEVRKREVFNILNSLIMAAGLKTMAQTDGPLVANLTLNFDGTVSVHVKSSGDGTALVLSIDSQKGINATDAGSAQNVSAFVRCTYYTPPTPPPHPMLLLAALHCSLTKYRTACCSHRQVHVRVQRGRGGGPACHEASAQGGRLLACRPPRGLELLREGVLRAAPRPAPGHRAQARSLGNVVLQVLHEGRRAPGARGAAGADQRSARQALD